MKKQLYKTAQIIETEQYVSLAEYDSVKDMFKVVKVGTFILPHPFWVEAKVLTGFML